MFDEINIASDEMEFMKILIINPTYDTVIWINAIYSSFFLSLYAQDMTDACKIWRPFIEKQD
jgi:hypothetical protein